MKKILTTGILAVISIGIIVFFIKLVIVDFAASLFRPLILVLLGKEYWVIPLTLVFVFLIILIAGFILSHIKFQTLLDRFFKKKGIEQSPGAFLIISPDVYFIAAIMKKIKFRRIDGQVEKMYVLYSPYAPFPWSGLPITFAKENKVIPLKISYREIYAMTASLGRNAPDIITEAKNQSTD